MCLRIKFIYKFKKNLVTDYMIKNNLNIFNFCNLTDISLRDYEELMTDNPNIDTIVFAKIVKQLKLKFADLFKWNKHFEPIQLKKQTTWLSYKW